MATITLGGVPASTSGELPALGSTAPDFTLTGVDLKPFDRASLGDVRLVLNIFPSVDTGVCGAAVRRFNALAAALEDTVVVCVSRDLPFAQARFCGAEGIENVRMGSDFRGGAFGRDYGVETLDGGFGGLLARAVVVLDRDRTVLYTQLVPEIGQEPDYDAAIAPLA